MQLWLFHWSNASDIFWNYQRDKRRFMVANSNHKKILQWLAVYLKKSPKKFLSIWVPMILAAENLQSFEEYVQTQKFLLLIFSWKIEWQKFFLRKKKAEWKNWLFYFSFPFMTKFLSHEVKSHWKTFVWKLCILFV